MLVAGLIAAGMIVLLVARLRAVAEPARSPAIESYREQVEAQRDVLTLPVPRDVSRLVRSGQREAALARLREVEPRLSARTASAIISHMSASLAAGSGPKR
ncbi:MAG: hypothetical protein HRU75_03860 [Planctomycetia bacterium]|nr:MAG: hypothetical protein HRU75_03860 [Planctomycetia bacterium]